MQYSSETYKLLCAMSRQDNGIDRSLFFDDALRNLYEDKYIKNSPNFHCNDVFITDKGKAYVEHRKAENFKYYFSVITNGILSIIAIVVSIIGLLR